MQASLEFPILPEQRRAAQRMRVSTLLALALHALPLLVAAGQQARALQALAALGHELLIEIELPASALASAGSEDTGQAQGEQRPPPVLPLLPQLREPPEATREPETKVTPAGAESEGTEPSPAEDPGPVLTEGVSSAGDGLFAGTGAGTLHAQICFIPPTTRWLGQIRDCSPIYEEYLDRINIPARPFTAGFPGFPDRTEFFAVNIQGSFRVSQPGRHAFRLKADDGAQLFIDGQLVVDNDGMHEAISRRGEVELSGGLHRIRVWYFQGVRYELALQLFVTPPDSAERLFTSEL
jgi:hypothetical protein